MGGVREEAVDRWAGRPLFQTNENRITLVAVAFERVALVAASGDWNRWSEVSFQSTNEWAPFSTTGQF
jgi:hypothetical protein